LPAGSEMEFPVQQVRDGLRELLFHGFGAIYKCWGRIAL
jgi:hypothetical protein